MKDYSKERNQSITNVATVHEVQEMYEMSKFFENQHNNKEIEGPYPIYKSKIDIEVLTL